MVGEGGERGGFFVAGGGDEGDFFFVAGGGKGVKACMDIWKRSLG